MAEASRIILSIRDLIVNFMTPDGIVNAVKGIDLDVRAEETLAIVGESGSGKSQMMMGIMDLLAKNGVAGGSAKYRNTELIGLSTKERNKIRGVKITMIFQEPMTSLDPLYPIGCQIAEPIIHHRRSNYRDARKRVLELLNMVGIPAYRIDSYPHELSGGQCQRVMIAMALANEPDILIADEPTTALDVTTQAQILALLRSLQQRFGMAVIMITHDLGLVRAFAERVAVVRHGELVEQGATADIFERPASDYTRMLIADLPQRRRLPPADNAPIVLEARDVQVDFKIRGGFFSGKSLPLRAVDGVHVRLRKGQTIGIVGESGSGKSTLARALLRLIRSNGQYRFGAIDISAYDRKRMRPLRKEMQLVFQDPYGSLSPRQTVGETVTEGLMVHEPGLTRGERERRMIAALMEVGLDPSVRNRYPHEFSGGQRQRIAIARAIILRPQVVILDEPTSALDRSVQRQVIDLLEELQRRHGLSYILISHDLSVVRAFSDYVIVMKKGVVVEEGETDLVFSDPHDPYVKALIAASHLA